MFKRKHAEIAAVMLACAAVAILTAPTTAQTKFLEKVRKHYQLDKTNGKCELCHEVKPKEEPSRKNLNKYGIAIQQDAKMKPLLGKDDKYPFTAADLDVVKDAAVKIESLDSDGDGASNKEELDLGTIPGDPKSIPEKRALEKYRKANPPKAAEPAMKK
ncbi:MAG TPA: thrombospondin type 3 repeat-containing protein [Planctomycetota bacterium]|nr:thrombospondin type 3 repeat-containing protein [Planctomycetota bacterium]